MRSVRTLAKPFACFALAACLQFCSFAANASPPVPDDLAITLRIEDASGPLVPGSSATLAFEVRQLGPNLEPRYYIETLLQPVPARAAQPFRLLNVPSSLCALSVYEDDEVDPPVLYYYILGDLPPIGQSAICRVRLEVLGPAESGFDQPFEFISTDDKNWGDPDFSNNVVAIHLGALQAAPLPTIGWISCAALAACLAVAGFMSQLSPRRG